MIDDAKPEADTLLPYRRWSEDALREVVVRAIEEAAANGLPGEHHYYLTFRTDFPGVVLPRYLLARYPREMTVVLQHAFTDLFVDRSVGTFSVVLSFGGAPSGLVVPFAALTAFADPYARFGLRFESTDPDLAEEAPVRTDGATQIKSRTKGRAGRGKPAAKVEAAQRPAPPQPVAPTAPMGQVVSLDAFRRRLTGNTSALSEKSTTEEAPAEV